MFQQLFGNNLPRPPHQLGQRHAGLAAEFVGPRPQFWMTEPVGDGATFVELAPEDVGRTRMPNVEPFVYSGHRVASTFDAAKS